MIVLPWPNKTLSPNARPSWRALWKAKRSAQLESWALAKVFKNSQEWNNCIGNWDGQKIPVHIFVYPPSLARRDEDNLLASLKAALDGVAKGLGVDDNRFSLSHTWCELDRPKGRIELRIG